MCTVKGLSLLKEGVERPSRDILLRWLQTYHLYLLMAPHDLRFLEIGWINLPSKDEFIQWET